MWGFGRAGMKIRRTLKQTLIITISGMLIPGKTFIRSRGSGLITCIHNYTGLSWEEIENLDCEYREVE